MKNNREIIQICNSRSYDTGNSVLTALASDGTCWQFVREHWKLIPQIPQMDIDQEPEPEEPEYPEGDIDPEEEGDIGPQDIDPEWRKRRY